MRNELIHVIKHITDAQLIKNMLENMNSRDVYCLMSLLDYVDKETQKLWLTVYNRLVSIR